MIPRDSIRKPNKEELSIRWKALKALFILHNGTAHGAKKRDLIKFYCEINNTAIPNRDFDRWILSMQIIFALPHSGNKGYVTLYYGNPNTIRLLGSTHKWY